MKEKRVKAVIQPIDEKENPVGRPIEVNDYAILVEGGERVEVKNKYGVRDYVGELAVITKGKEIPLAGIYGQFRILSIPQLLIDVREDKVIVRYLPPFIRSLSLIYSRRRPGEREYQPMKSEEIVKEGEYIDLKIPLTYREIGREISIRGITPVVDDDVLIRIEARKLEKELYQK